MDTRIFDSYTDMCKATADMIIKTVNAKPDALLCLAAGHTSLGVFEILIDEAENNHVSFSRCRFIGLDEWIGLGRGDDGSCINFMYDNLFIPLGISDKQIIFYDGHGNPENECTRIDDYIRQYGPIDIMLLGMGMNGHLGLNEPGTPFNRYSHIVDLDETTKSVGQKYFKNKTPLVSGITMGMLHIKHSHMVILCVNGKKKAQIVSQLFNNEPSEMLPASYLKTLSNAALFLDREAAGTNTSKCCL